MTSSPPPAQLPQIAEGGMADGKNFLQVVPAQQQHQLPGQVPNPLLIDAVLDNVFGYVDFADLSTCRAVSQQWHKVSLPHWLRKGPRLHLELDPDRRHRHMKTEDDAAKHEKITTMSKFIRLVDNDFHSYGPYEYAGLRQYQTFGVKGDLGAGVQHQLFALFLRSYGQRVKDLVLSLRFPDQETFHAVLFSTMSPNLVKLELADVSFAEDVIINSLDGDLAEGVVEHTKLTSLQIDCKDEVMCSLGWIQLLRRYPNLQTIVYGVNQIGGDGVGVHRLMQAIWRIRQLDRSVLNLKRLEIGCCYLIKHQTSLTPLFRDSQLALETLRLSAVATPNRAIYNVLDSQASTLRHLNIHSYFPTKNYPFQHPPRMSLVTRLELVGYPFENLSFLKSFPNLKSLSFTSEGFIHHKLHSILEATTTKHLEGVTTTTSSSLITSLRCHYKSYVYHGDQDGLSPGDVRRLHRIMPNLTDLQLWVDNAGLREACQCWPRLQSLTVVGNEVGDWGLAGLYPGVKQAKRKYKSGQDLKSFAMMQIEETYLVIPDHWPPMTTTVYPRFTEKTFHAFLQLPKLEKLDISLPHLELELNPTLVGRLKEKVIKGLRINLARWTVE